MASIVELTLDRVEPKRYALADVGTLHALPRYAAEITAGGTTWRLKRAALGFGQVINAVDVASTERVARYVPKGFLHLRGMYRGELRIGERAWSWRANHQMGRHFALIDGDETLAEFDAHAGAVEQPVSVQVADRGRIEPLLLLFCCHVAKQQVDTAMAGWRIAAGATVGRGAGI